MFTYLNSTYIIIYLSIYIVYLSIFVLLRPFNQFNLLWEFRSLFMTVLYLSIYLSIYLQGDQLYIAVLFWYLGKHDLFNVRYCTLLHVANTSVTFNKVPEQHGHVHLVGLYLAIYSIIQCDAIRWEQFCGDFVLGSIYVAMKCMYISGSFCLKEKICMINVEPHSTTRNSEFGFES